MILVEGYFDVLRLVIAGMRARRGAAGHRADAASRRRCSSATRSRRRCSYDTDAPGSRPPSAPATSCSRQGARVKVATLPAGEDPDTLVRQGGAEALEPMLRDAVDVFERKIQLLERKGWFEGLEHRREALDRLLPTIRAAQDPITRELYISRVAERTGVEKKVLEHEVGGDAGVGGTWGGQADGRAGGHCSAAGQGRRPTPGPRQSRLPG